MRDTRREPGGKVPRAAVEGRGAATPVPAGRHGRGHRPRRDDLAGSGRRGHDPRAHGRCRGSWNRTPLCRPRWPRWAWAPSQPTGGTSVHSVTTNRSPGKVLPSHTIRARSTGLEHCLSTTRPGAQTGWPNRRLRRWIRPQGQRMALVDRPHTVKRCVASWATSGRGGGVFTSFLDSGPNQVVPSVQPRTGGTRREGAPSVALLPKPNYTWFSWRPGAHRITYSPTALRPAATKRTCCRPSRGVRTVRMPCGRIRRTSPGRPPRTTPTNGGARATTPRCC